VRSCEMGHKLGFSRCPPRLRGARPDLHRSLPWASVEEAIPILLPAQRGPSGRSCAAPRSEGGEGVARPFGAMRALVVDTSMGLVFCPRRPSFIACRPEGASPGPGRSARGTERTCRDPLELLRVSVGQRTSPIGPTSGPRVTTDGADWVRLGPLVPPRLRGLTGGCSFAE